MNAQSRANGCGLGATPSLTEDVARHLLCAVAESCLSADLLDAPATAAADALARPIADGDRCAVMLLRASQERLRARLAREMDDAAVAATCLFILHRRLLEGMPNLPAPALAWSALADAWGLARPSVWDIARRLADLARASAEGDDYDYAASLNALYRLAVDHWGAGSASEGGSYAAQPLE